MLSVVVVVSAFVSDPVGMGVPAVGGILYSLRNEGNLKLSQKLIHTRVYGQMTVVSMVVRTSCPQAVPARILPTLEPCVAGIK